MAENRRKAAKREKPDGLPIAANADREIVHVRCEEMEWLAAHRVRLDDNLAGEWVAVSGTRLVAHGPELKNVLQEAERAGFPRPFISCIRRREPKVWYVPSFRLV
jgi:hypothetical protein